MDRPVESALIDLSVKERDGMSPDQRGANPDHDVSWFIEHFVLPGHRPRWQHFMLEKPDKAKHGMHKFDSHHDPRRCHPTSVELLNDTQRAKRGVLIKSDGATSAPSLKYAIDSMSGFMPDAFFCASDHSFAVAFHHDGHVWMCQEP
jgi:hypothetical protein